MCVCVCGINPSTDALEYLTESESQASTRTSRSKLAQLKAEQESFLENKSMYLLYDQIDAYPWHDMFLRRKILTEILSRMGKPRCIRIFNRARAISFIDTYFFSRR